MDPKQQEELAERLTMMRHRGAEWNRPLVADVEMTLAFISGYQWMEYNWSAGGLLPIQESNRVRITDNRMQAAYARWLYYMFLEDPVLIGHEGAKELSDAESAKAASKIFDYWENNCGFREARKEAVGWMALAGIGYVLPVYTTTRGQHVESRPKVLDEPQQTSDGRWSFLGEKEVRVRRKELSFWSLNPMNTYCFPLTASKWTEVDAVINADLATKEWIVRNIPGGVSAVEGASPAGPGVENQQAQDRVNRFISPFFGLRTDVTPDERFWVTRYWERPTSDRPKGRYVVMIGDQIAVDRKLPYAEDALRTDPTDAHNLSMGIVPYRAMELPGRLVPPSPFSEMRRAQIRLNDLLTDQARNRKTVGRNKLLVQKDSVRDGQWNEEHGEMLEIEPQEAGFKPQFVQAPPLVGIDNELNRAEMSLEEASGQTAVLRGQNPTQARAAEQLEILREESLTLLSSQSRQHEQAYELTGRLALTIAQRRYSLPRLVQIVGRRKSGWAVQFKHADLIVDVRIKKGSLIPRNHALKEAKIVDRARYGIYNDPKTGQPDVRLIRKALEMGSFAPADMEEMHRERAEQEFLWIVLEQKLIPPLEEEPHDVHAEQHRADMARQEFAEADPEIQELFRLHLDMHRQMWASQNAPETSDPITGTLTNGVGQQTAQPRRSRSRPQRGSQGGAQAQAAPAQAPVQQQPAADSGGESE